MSERSSTQAEDLQVPSLVDINLFEVFKGDTPTNPLKPRSVDLIRRITIEELEMKDGGQKFNSITSPLDVGQVSEEPVAADTSSYDNDSLSSRTDDNLLLSPSSPACERLTLEDVESGFENLETPRSGFVSQEDLLDTIFYSCKPDDEERVPVAKLVHYIQMIMLSSHLTEAGIREITHLANILNSTSGQEGSEEVKVDLATYQHGIREWITNVQSQSREKSLDSSSLLGESSTLPPALTCCLSNTKPQQYFSLSLDQSAISSVVQNLSIFNFGSFEEMGEDTSRKGENQEMLVLQNYADDLEHQTKKMSEQNTQLQAALESNEEQNNQLMTTVEQLKEQLKSASQTSAKCHGLRQDNDDLKSAVFTFEEHNKLLNNRVSTLEKENNILETKITEYEEEYHNAVYSSEKLQSDYAALTELLKDHKEQRIQLEEKLTITQLELEERSNRCSQLEGIITDLDHLSQVLKSEKTELEMQLSEMRQELSLSSSQSSKSIHFQYVNSSKAAAASGVPRQSSSLPSLRIHSRNQPSLHYELQNLVSSEEDLPSPLCGNQAAVAFADPSTDMLASSSSIEDEVFEDNSQSPSSSSSSSSTDIFRVRVANMVEEMSQLVGTITANGDLDGTSMSSLMTLKHEMQVQVNCFLEKYLQVDPEIQQKNENSTVELTSQWEKLLEDKKDIHRKYQEAVQEIEVLTSSRNASNSRCELFQQLLEQEKSKVQELSDKMSKITDDEETLRCKICQLEGTLEYKTGKLATLTDEFSQTKESMNAVEKVLSRERETLAELVRKLEKSEKKLSQKNGECVRCQELVTAQKYKYKADLKSILDILVTSDSNSFRLIKSSDEEDISIDFVREAVEHTLNHFQASRRLDKSWKRGEPRWQGVHSESARTARLADDDDCCPDYQSNRRPVETQGSARPLPYSPLTDALALELLCSRKGAWTESNSSSSSSSNKLVATRKQSAEDLYQLFVHQNEGRRQPVAPSTWVSLKKAESCPGLVEAFTSQLGSGPSTQRPAAAASRSCCNFPEWTHRIIEVSSKPSARHTSSSLMDDTHSKDVKRSEKFVTIGSTKLQTPTKDADTAMEESSIRLSPTETSTASPEPVSSHRTMAATDRVQEEENALPTFSLDAGRGSAVRSCRRVQDVREMRVKAEGVAEEGRAGALSAGQRLQQQQQEQRLAELVNGDWVEQANSQSDDSETESRLSEADKRINSQLLQEARKASEKHPHRRQRRHPSSSKEDIKGHLAENHSSTSTLPTSVVPAREEPSSAASPVRIGALVQRLPADNNNSISKILPPGGATSPVVAGEVLPLRKVSGLLEARRDSDVDVKADILKALENPAGGLTATSVPDLPFKSPLKHSTPLAKLREENKMNKRRDNIKFKMPELSEASETESTREESDYSTSEDLSVESTSPDNSKAAISRLPGTPEVPSNSPVTPTLPDSVLETLEVLNTSKKDSKASIKPSPYDFTEQETEAKFSTLALAFKTDKYTLEKRVDLQQRQRDVAEKNILNEINSLRQALEGLNPVCADLQSRDILAKLKKHVDILHQSSNRLSSKAEIYGAVQQEGRLNTATEVMVNHVENLKKMYEREHGELEETKKILQENKVLYRSTSSDGGETESMGGRLNKRSMSIALTGGTKSGGRRRASLSTFIGFGAGSTPPTDAKSRFTQIVANAAMKNKVTNLLREKSQTSLTQENGSPTDIPESGVTTTNGVDANANESEGDFSLSPSPSSPDRKFVIKLPAQAAAAAAGGEKSSLKEATSPHGAYRSSREEQIFQQGFEHGVRAQVSQDMDHLRVQQRSFCDSLDELMETVDQDEENDEHEPSSLNLSFNWRELLSRLQTSREKSSRALRLTIASILFVLALFSLVFTMLPFDTFGSDSSLVQMGWKSWTELIWRYSDLQHPTGAPPR